jgi:hypothetical protein
MTRFRLPDWRRLTDAHAGAWHLPVFPKTCRGDRGLAMCGVSLLPTEGQRLDKRSQRKPWNDQAAGDDICAVCVIFAALLHCWMQPTPSSATKSQLRAYVRRLQSASSVTVIDLTALEPRLDAVAEYPTDVPSEAAPREEVAFAALR